MLCEIRKRQMLYELIYMWNLKTKNETKIDRKRDQTGGYQ